MRILQNKKHVFVWLLFVLVLFCQNVSAKSEDQTQSIFKEVQQSVYQIQVIDLATGKKHSIGSGFQIDPQGHIATNFHVVSAFVRNPSMYRIEFFASDGQSGPVQLAAIDVIHDLAIVHRTQQTNGKTLLFGSSGLVKGAKIFSLGNPFDLGMTIIEGIYNGEMEQSMYHKILFSGSLNPGMSGGPSLDQNGNVIGINVATQGNQISFLVPVEYLKKLYASIDSPAGDSRTWGQQIEQQLYDNQKGIVAAILNSDWKNLEIGEASVPGEMTENFRCWGRFEDKPKSWSRYASSMCSTEDVIYVSEYLQTNRIIYKYGWLTNKGVNPFRFYNTYQNYFSQMEGFYNASEDDVGNFQCRTDFVLIAGHRFKASFCARRYKQFKRIYDIDLSLASVDAFDRGLMAELSAFGVSQESSHQLISKFMKGIKWEK